jgi:MFS family permease
VDRFAGLRPLRHRRFAVIWTAALVSNVGTWMQTVAVGTLITERTGDAGQTGLVAAAGFLPVGLLSPVGGALADRVDRRRLLFLTTLGETFFAALLAVLYASGHASIAAVDGCVFGGGCMAALGFPCYQAMLPDLVPAEDLLGAVSLGSAQFNLGRVIGPALAGLTISLGSYSWAFGVNAASFGAVLVAVAVIRVASPMVDEGSRLWAEIRRGARYAREEPGIRTAILLASAMSLTASPFIALIPAIAVKVFHGDASTTSVLVTGQGIGAVIGALALAPLAERYGRRRMIVLFLGLLLPGALVLYASSPVLALAAVAVALVGGAYISCLSGLNAVVQLRAPDELRGRLVSLYFVAVGVLYPIGAVVQGRLADAVGLRWVTGGAAVLLALTVAAARALRPRTIAALDTVAERGPSARSPLPVGPEPGEPR